MKVWRLKELLAQCDDNDEIDIAISRNGSDGYETQTRAAIEQVKGPFQRRARWIICGWGGRG